MARTSLAFTAAILSVLTLPARGQSLLAPAVSLPTTIVGRVVADSTGTPLPNVCIAVTGASSGAPVFTDADGRFSVLAPNGRFTIVASKSAYVRNEVTPATTGDPIEIRLRRAGAISGRVLDDFGEPIIGARVTAEARSGSPPKLTTIVTTETDDRGEYRLATLPSGSFVVAVTTVATPALIRSVYGNVIGRNSQKMYYPGVSEAEAESVSLQAAEDRTGFDFVVPSSLSGSQPFSAAAALPFNPLTRAQDRATRAAGRVRGRVVDSDKRPLPYAQVVLTSQGIEARVVHGDSAGVFEVLELAARTFQLGASKPGYFPVSARDSTAPAVITLADDEKRDDVEITLRRWGTLTGRILDEYGDPMQGVGIQLLQVRYEGGRRRLVAAANTPTAGGVARVTGRPRRVSVFRPLTRSVHCRHDNGRYLLTGDARLCPILFSRDADTQ